MAVTDISAAHRLGPKPKSRGPDRRKIIVKLCRRERKYDLITACKQTKPPNLFINENWNNILISLRCAKKKFPNIVAACSSHDGKVFAWIKPLNPDAPLARNSKLFINTQDQLQDFCRKSLKVQIEELHKWKAKWRLCICTFIIIIIIFKPYVGVYNVFWIPIAKYRVFFTLAYISLIFCSFYSSSRFNVLSINSQFLYVAELIVSSGCIRWWKLISQYLLFIAKLTSLFVLNILLNFPLHSLFWISLFKLFLLQTHFFPWILT